MEDEDMAFERRAPKPAGAAGAPPRRRFMRRKGCRFCADNNLKIDYKDVRGLRYFISERGKIVPRRISGNCADHQRKVTEAIKRARNIALIPFTASQAFD
jgi:small subunit ribosomal protein S18